MGKFIQDTADEAEVYARVQKDGFTFDACRDLLRLYQKDPKVRDLATYFMAVGWRPRLSHPDGYVRQHPWIWASGNGHGVHLEKDGVLLLVSSAG